MCTARTLVLLSFLTLTSTSAQLPAASLTPVYDGFESSPLSDLWEPSRFMPDAVTAQWQLVRAGRSAVRIDLRPHDKFGAGKDGDLDTERDEVMEASRLNSREDMPYEYSWSMYLPADFPIVPTRLVVAQW